MFLVQWLYEIHNHTGGRSIELLSSEVLSQARTRRFVFETDHFASLQARSRPKIRNAYEDLFKRMNKIAPATIDSATGRYLDMLFRSVQDFCVANYVMR